MEIIKIGGNELSDPLFLSTLAQTIKTLGRPVVIVHGGGHAIADLQTRLGLTIEKVEGLRVTDDASMEVAQMVMSGQANKLLVRSLLAAGVDAIGLSGVDGGLLRCRKKPHPTADLGLVGQIDTVRHDLIAQLMALNLVLVLSPVSLGHDGLTYNVNADEAATAVALALNAHLLTFISNVPGVLENGRLHPTLTVTQTDALIEHGVITDGMVPKVRAATAAVAQGVPRARITNLAGFQTNSGTLFNTSEAGET